MKLPNADTYADKYDKVLLKSLRRIDSEIKGLIKVVDKTKSNREKMAILLNNRKELIDKLRETSKASYNIATRGAFKKTIKDVNRYFKNKKLDAPFLATDLDAFKNIPRDAILELVGHAGNDGRRIFQELINYALTGNRQQLQRGLLGNLTKAKIARYGKTITHTSVSIFGRTVAGTKSIRAGIKKFKYVGPPPERAWCKAVPVGAILTKDEIDALPSGPGGLDPFYAGGGWNCRHRWVPVTEGL